MVGAVGFGVRAQGLVPSWSMAGGWGVRSYGLGDDRIGAAVVSWFGLWALCKDLTPEQNVSQHRAWRRDNVGIKNVAHWVLAHDPVQLRG